MNLVWKHQKVNGQRFASAKSDKFHYYIQNEKIGSIVSKNNKFAITKMFYCFKEAQEQLNLHHESIQ